MTFITLLVASFVCLMVVCFAGAIAEYFFLERNEPTVPVKDVEEVLSKHRKKPVADRPEPPAPMVEKKRKVNWREDGGGQQ